MPKWLKRMELNVSKDRELQPEYQLCAFSAQLKLVFVVRGL